MPRIKEETEEQTGDRVDADPDMPVKKTAKDKFKSAANKLKVHKILQKSLQKKKVTFEKQSSTDIDDSAIPTSVSEGAPAPGKAFASLDPKSSKKTQKDLKAVFLKLIDENLDVGQFFADDGTNDYREEIERDNSKYNNASGTLKVQALRSVSEWSHGLPLEHSIYNTYLDLINNSEKFIYIENQFFITGTGEIPDDGYHKLTTNRIGKAIADRIVKAHQEQKPFKVYVIMPVMPCFPAENIWTSEGFLVRANLAMQYESINRGKNSIVASLKRRGIENWEDYICWYSLRQWGFTPDGVLHVNQIYIHSKCIIVDDKHILIGSANINDRSMIGNHDSEFALHYDCSGGDTFAQDARWEIWGEHLMFTKTSQLDIIKDPSSASCWNYWKAEASNNEKILVRHKPSIWPRSDIKTWKQHRAVVDYPDPGSTEADLKRDNPGRLVFHPIGWCEDENLWDNKGAFGAVAAAVALDAIA